MAVTAALVKELRERTGLGMMECKKALVSTDGNIEVAIENLRKSGQAKAAKKAGRVAAEGVVQVQVTAGEGGASQGVLVEINSETDFVARDDSFQAFANQVAATALSCEASSAQALSEAPMLDSQQSVEVARQHLVQKIGENIQIRRVHRLVSPVVGSYSHNGKIGVLVALTGGDEALAKDIAMHIAAVNPMVVNPQDVPESVQAKEKEIFAEQARQSGKPEEIIEKMIGGRVQKFLAEVSLVEQAFVKDPQVKIGELLKKAGASVQAFKRFEVGEGIEKETVDFKAEVMAQVEGK